MPGASVPGTTPGGFPSAAGPILLAGASNVTALADALAWQPNTVYLANQLVSNGGSTYIANVQHQSGGSFPGAGALWTAVGGGGGGGGGLEDWYNVTQSPYTADPTGAADSTATIQAAINYAKANGGVVYFPNGTYKITSPLYLGNNAYAFRLTGASGDGHINNSNPTIHLSGTSGGTGHNGGAIQFGDATTGQSGYSIEMDHLRFTYDPASFTGAGTYLINVSPYNNGAGDIQPFDIHHCGFSAASPVSNAGCQSLLRLNQAIIGTIHDCAFGSAQEGIRVGDPGGSYVNVVTIQRCAFNYMQSAAIMIGSGDCETITIRDCTFEDAPANGAIYGAAGNNTYNLTIENNWFGDYDLTYTPGYWINGIACEYPMTIKNNRFATIVTGYHLNWTGLAIVQGNSFENGTAVYNISWGSSSLVDIANTYNNSTAVFATDPSTTSNANLWQFSSNSLGSSPAPLAGVVTDTIRALGPSNSSSVRDNPTRWVGATSSGAPSAGTFAEGDWIIDRTGLVWICTAAGTPGTWVSSAGVTLNGAQTLTNKRITKRVLDLSANSAAPAVDTDNYDVVHVTAQTATITGFTMTGTPTDGDTLRISITGTAAVPFTLGSSFEAGAAAIPTTTVSTARLDMGFLWNTETSKWRCMAAG